MERLTEKIIERETKRQGRKIAAWYKLTKDGYLPLEIAVWLPSVTPHDISYRVRDYAERHRLPIPATCARKLIRKPISTEIDWRQAFRNFTLRTGFALILTRPMLEYVCAVADDVVWDRSRYFQLGNGATPDNWIATNNALLKRGLIRRKKKSIPGDQHYELTPAGLVLVEMLKLTGEFKVADAAFEKKKRG